MQGKVYNFEDRLVQFAGEIIFFCKTLPNDTTGKYYSDQLLRSSGSAALNYGEAQGAKIKFKVQVQVSNASARN